MADATTMTATALQGETLDALVWRVARGRAEMVEKVLLMNYGLSDIGTILPEGHAVILPVVKAESVPVYDIVQLWN
ncbi:tail protein X [Asticcacaulis machinosus]|uniref:Tail protein X n=1 Tax=Asticcacaulis machinosus TaxID=2984211 RepID=A0ABT5HGZ9_9CAUL|nr:tail protein X [Asticcacaulis machinosus]MDC7675371.1 tail protein X [Asticcacaulis machinosus]